MHFSYFDPWKDKTLECRKCSWTGTFDEGEVELFKEVMHSECPKCGSILATVTYPTLKEMKANLDKLDKTGRAMLGYREEWLGTFEKRSLKSPEDLPDIDADSIVLLWDFEHHNDHAPETLIKWRGTVIWREPAGWEGFSRFEEVVHILRQRYGPRLRDVRPSSDSELYLYGDDLSSIQLVERIRASISDRKR